MIHTLLARCAARFHFSTPNFPVIQAGLWCLCYCLIQSISLQLGTTCFSLPFPTDFCHQAVCVAVQERLVLAPESSDSRMDTGANQSSLFLSLPAELRRMVFEALLPHNFTIEFDEDMRMSSASYGTGTDTTAQRVSATPSADPLSNVQHMRYSYGQLRPLPLNVFLVNKQFHSEAAAVLYGQNQFHFHFTHRTRQPEDTFNRLALRVVAYFKVIEIVIRASLYEWRTYRSVQQSLRVIVAALCNANRHPRTRLRVDLRSGHWDNYRSIFTNYETIKYQYVLEPLADLRNFQNVEIAGDVSKKFAMQLGSLIRADLTVEKPPKAKKKTKTVTSHKRGHVTWRKRVVPRPYCQNEYDWESLEE